MLHAVISGDVIASTSLNEHGKRKVEDALKGLISELKDKYNVYGRLIKGDYLECFIPVPVDALRIALIIKSLVKSIVITVDDVNSDQAGRLRLFKTYGIRVAIGIGELSRLDIENNIVDGEAIYLSGRIINAEKTHNREKVTIKNTLFIKSSDEKFDKEIQPLLALIDVLMNKITEKQCEVLCLKLLGNSEDIIMKKLNQRQSTINEKSTSAGWSAIEKAVQRFEYVMKNRIG